MESYLPLDFLQEKIMSLRTALFFSLSPSVLRFLVSVISALHIDEAGQIFFYAHGTLPLYKELGNSFPSHLQFFRKGEKFFLRIQGNASIMNNPAEIKKMFFVTNKMQEEIFSGKTVIMKVQIQYADYFKSKPPAKKSEWKNIPEQLYHLLFKPYEPGHTPQRIFVLPN